MAEEVRKLPTAYGPGFVPVNEATSFDFAKSDEVIPKWAITKTLVSPKVAILMNILVIVIVMVYSLFYLGCLWSPLTKLHNVPFAVVNYDAGFDFSSTDNPLVQQRFNRIFKNASVGENIMQVIFNSSVSETLSFERIPPSTPIADLNDRLEKGEFWGYLEIPPSFSNDMLSNVMNTTTFKPSPSAKNMTITYAYNQARQMTVTGFVTAAIKTIVTSVTAGIVNGLLKESEYYPNGYQSLLVTPRFLSNPITLEIVNIHPIPFFGLNFASYISLIVLWITGIIIASIVFQVFNARFDNLQPHMEHKHFMVRYILTGLGVMMVLTLLSALTMFLMLFLLSGLNTSFLSEGHTSIQLIAYFWLIALSFLSFSAFFASWMGYDIFASAVSLLLIIQLSTSSAILDPVVMHDFTRLTYAFPFYYSVQGLRCILLGSQCGNMVLNTVVPGCWLFGMTGLTMLAVYFKTTGKVLAKMA